MISKLKDDHLKRTGSRHHIRIPGQRNCDFTSDGKRYFDLTSAKAKWAYSKVDIPFTQDGDPELSAIMKKIKERELKKRKRINEVK